MSDVLGTLLFVAIPAVTIIVGSVIATYVELSGITKSAIQHFAAGVVFYAVAEELLPQVIHKNAPLEIIIGFSVGVALLIATRKFGRYLEKRDKSTGTTNPFSFLTAVGIDVTVDGLLVGLGFAVGSKEGIILAIALGIEDGFLGLTVGLQLWQAHMRRGKTIWISCGLALLTLVGGLVGVTLLDNLPAGLLEAVLAFAVAALLYLVTEELLVEAHEERETSLTTSMFFSGFLVFLIIGLLT